jgi:HK97 family phage prohead protease
MKIEVREESVVISGYVNAIERYSKPIRESLRGQIRTFIERIKAGVFKTALKRNDDVKVLLNHDHERVLATTKDGSAKLEEDNIGLRAEVTITDAEVVEKARNNQLVGWSFGFYANSDEVGTEGNQETRTITDLDLIEVSILDDTKSPAYYGTSIEARAEEEKTLEYRATMDEIKEIEQEAMEKHEEVYVESEEQHKQIEEEKYDALIDIVVNKVLEKLNGTREEKTIPEETLVEEEKEEVEEENRSTKIDYSEFEQRIANLK